MSLSTIVCLLLPFGSSLNGSAAGMLMRHVSPPISVVQSPDSTATDSLPQDPHFPHELQVQEAVVRGTRRAASVNAVSQSLNSDQIQRAMGTSLAHLLQQVSGVTSLQTGTTLAKPVIQGMYGTRILLVNNGARQTGQQWGLDHAPEVDQNASHHIEVVKGAEAVRYGAEALGGIVLLEQKPLPYGHGKIHAQFTTVYGNNGHRATAFGGLEGGLPTLPHWAWRTQFSVQNGGDRSTAHYLLNNTGTREANAHIALGYHRDAWRTEAFYSLYANKTGVMYGAQMGNEELLAERIALGQPVETLPFARDIDYPFQRVVHHNVTFKGIYRSPSMGRWQWQTTFQADHREEHRFRRLNRSYLPAVALHLHSWQHRLRWDKKYGNWTTEAGMQWSDLNNTNEAGTGVVPVIPNYTERMLGIYALQKFNHGAWNAEAGLRFDHQTMKADGYDWRGARYGGQRTFDNLSYTLAARCQLTDHWSLTTNFGLAWRAPHVYELYSNGNELGSGIFVRGNDQLRSEQGYKWITSLHYDNHPFTLRVDGFIQWIDRYIYDAPTHERITVVSGAYPVFAYRQNSAFFRGLDIDFTVRVFRHLHYHLVGSLLWANEGRTHQFLPYIPAPRFRHELAWRIEDFSLSVQHQAVLRQTRFDPATDLIPYAPSGYHLFGLEAAYTWKWATGRIVQLRFIGENLFNRAYKEYTNRARYYAHDLGRDLRFAVHYKF